MRDFGAVTAANSRHLIAAIFNPWIGAGICLLILFFCTYLTALSWADLTYVLPATALSYILMALLAHIFLHEGVPLSHWIGIGLITIGVGFVATGPESTTAAAALPPSETCGAHTPVTTPEKHVRTDA